VCHAHAVTSSRSRSRGLAPAEAGQERWTAPTFCCILYPDMPGSDAQRKDVAASAVNSRQRSESAFVFHEAVDDQVTVWAHELFSDQVVCSN
jgi:hypothetical protein